jgi:hypothetical protein
MSSARPRIAVICHDGDPINRELLPRWVAGFADLAGVVAIRERRGVLLKRLRAEIRRVGWLRLLDVFAFRLYYKLRLAAADARWEREHVARLTQRFAALPPDTALQVTDNPNDAATEEFLRRAQPDIVIARCSWLLARRIYSIARIGTFVLHPGVCPEYRNSHGCFWALAQRDLRKVGLTLLKIDDGIDTGPIYRWFSYAFDERTESHIRIQLRMFTENLDPLAQAFLDLAAGRLAPVSVTGRSSKNWGQPWLSAWRRWKRQARASQ